MTGHYYVHLTLCIMKQEAQLSQRNSTMNDPSRWKFAVTQGDINLHRHVLCV